MTAIDFRSAPADFFKNGTHPIGSDVYKWWWNAIGSPQVLDDPDITKGVISTKWSKNEIIIQDYAEYNSGIYTTRRAWQQVLLGSFGAAGKGMNGTISQDYQAYTSFRSSDQELGIMDGDVLAQYRTTNGVKWRLAGGVLTGELNVSMYDDIPSQVWNKYFNGFFTYSDPVSANGVHVLDFTGNGVAPSPALDTLTGTPGLSDILDFAKTPSFEAGTADTITNFNPREKDKLQIQLSIFDEGAEGTFSVAKNSKALTKLLATSTSFIYLRTRGELYFNENGTSVGFGNGGVFAVLEGNPSIKTANIGFI